MRLVLASASPRRVDLLRAAGFEFEVLAVDVDERPRPGEAPREYVRRLAAEKSARAMERLGAHAGDLVVIGADTVVVLDGDILGKPRNDGEVAVMLGRLSNRRHDVVTGVSIRRDARDIERVVATHVEFSRLTPAEIAWYVASGEGRDKAGAYAIQGLASRFIPRIDGSYANVVGLPISSVHELVVEIASNHQSGYSER